MTRRRLNLAEYGTQGESARSRTSFDALIEGAPSDTAKRAQELGLPLRYIATKQIAPNFQQLRKLPHPDDLRAAAEQGDSAASMLLEELSELGQSIQEHGQLQPIIVYPEDNEGYRILMGQRRWSAAVLLGIETLWAVEVEKPSEVTRILKQYAENEQRASLTDMERCWALLELKQALTQESGEEAPWEIVEARFGMSEQRRYDMLRLMRFTQEGQQIIARYGWSEWTLRKIHMDIKAGKLLLDQATLILHRLAGKRDINASVVQQVLEEFYEQQASGPDDHTTNTATESDAMAERKPARKAVFAKSMLRYRTGLDKLAEQVGPDLEERERAAALEEVNKLMESLLLLAERLGAPAKQAGGDNPEQVTHAL